MDSHLPQSHMLSFYFKHSPKKKKKFKLGSFFDVEADLALEWWATGVTAVFSP